MPWGKAGPRNQDKVTEVINLGLLGDAGERFKALREESSGLWHCGVLRSVRPRAALWMSGH